MTLIGNYLTSENGGNDDGMGLFFKAPRFSYIAFRIILRASHGFNVNSWEQLLNGREAGLLWVTKYQVHVFVPGVPNLIVAGTGASGFILHPQVQGCVYHFLRCGFLSPDGPGRVENAEPGPGGLGGWNVTHSNLCLLL